MEDNISALMDGELNAEDAAVLIDQLGNTDGLREHWAAYHLISDAMKHAELAPFDITRRVTARLAVEPPLAPLASPSPVGSRAFAQRLPKKRRPVAFAAAASIAAMVVGGWMSLQTTQSTDPRQQNLADNRSTFTPAESATLPMASVHALPANVSVTESAPSQINSYLLAHRQFSPSTTVHGITPYMRTTAESRENFAR